MIEKRFSELRQTGERRIEGVVITYGEIADLPQGKEKFVAGAFGENVASLDVILNSHHLRSSPLARAGGGGLTLTDSSVALTLVAQLPPSQAGDDVLSLIRAGVLRGLSLEFLAISARQEDGVRVISKAELSGVAVVDRPAYLDSEVVARNEDRQARSRGRVRGRIPYRAELQCECQRGSGDCGNVSFESTAFDDAMTDDRLIVFAKDYAAPLASRRRETLRLTQGADGLDVEFDLPDTQAARDLIASNRNVPLIIRPLFEKADSKFVNDVQSGVSTYSSVAVRALLIGSTDASKGWPPSEIIGPPRRRRHQIWFI